MGGSGGSGSQPLAPVAISIPQQKVFDGKPFPLVWSPPSGSTASFADWLAWASSHQKEAEVALGDFGAILFRGFPIATPEQFDAFLKALGQKPFPYVGGAAPRTLVAGDVFTTNESPPDQPIPFHHEMAQVPKYPPRIAFWCLEPPAAGGETPLLLSPAVFASISASHPAFVAELLAKGLVYTRVLPDGDDPSSPIGRGWQSTYGTQDRAAAVAAAAELGVAATWRPDGCLTTVSAVLPAVRPDPRHPGRMCWFNSMVAAYTGWRDSRNAPESAVTFGDGGPLPPDAVAAVDAAMQRDCVAIPWERGDLQLIDNNTVQHSRRTFVPPRRILAYLGYVPELS